ncbi:DUF1127 domain-containing protein [Jannaschia sp. Os4]|uniref:DUF1127 domain-containing protein n=1 Tax=Jannaschia sp. Os4 TaxID=2807617 RepID=UPI0019395401|nr:DUF1127 domain-containing protein [Jannaschia sp. Os4]MBM2576969.1 DUF1127 domain-containing protein [Jannaschia sp. Os4]
MATTAYATQTFGSTLAAAGALLRGRTDEARAAWNRYKLYRQTVRELSALSDRTLADLGLNRGMIHATALDAAR